MAFTYCPSCGYKNLHGVSSPKFCGGCGAELNRSLATAPKVAPKTRGGRKKPQWERGIEEDSEGTDVYEVPTLEGLKYTLSHGEFGANKVTFEDLAGEVTEDQLKEVQAAERGKSIKGKRGRPKGSKNKTHGKRRNKRK